MFKIFNLVNGIIIFVLFHKYCLCKNLIDVHSVNNSNLTESDVRYGLVDVQYPIRVADVNDDTELHDAKAEKLMDRVDVSRTSAPKNYKSDDLAWNKIYSAYAEPYPVKGDASDESNEYSSLPNSDEDYLESLCQPSTLIRKIERLNKTKTSHDGKIYQIKKVIKGRKCKRKRTPKNQLVQRRTFNVLPGLSSVIPWMTKKVNEVNDDVHGIVEYKNTGGNVKLEKSEKIQTDDGEAGNVRPDLGANYNIDKFKKVLSLFTIVKFDNGDCFFNGLKGTCLHQIECQGKGGKSIGSCAKGFGICCYVERSCGERTRENCTYFVNEGFPKPSTVAPRVCSLVVEKAHSQVEQLRLEFLVFELRGPNNGTCISDRLTVTGHNTNHIVPDICGFNNQQHVYVDVDDSNGPYNLNIITMGGDFPRTFQIKITQIQKGDELLAPKNCLQYYTEVSGVVQTLNYQYGNLDNFLQAPPGYFNNLNYVICLKKHVGFCSVSYENEERGDSEDNPTFQLLNTDSDGTRLLPPNQGGAEVFDCPDDYIIVNGVRLCGEKLNDATIDADYTKNYPVTDFSNGPFILQVRTNNAVNGRGFYLKYRQNPCLQ